MRLNITLRTVIIVAVEEGINVLSNEISNLWNRAVQAFQTARYLLSVDADAAASRAYYSAFYAASAVLVLKGKSFTNPSSDVVAVVQKELVKTGEWDGKPGEHFLFLHGLHEKGDYGKGGHVSAKEAEKATNAASRILKTIQKAHPEKFRGKWDWD